MIENIVFIDDRIVWPITQENRNMWSIFLKGFIKLLYKIAGTYHDIIDEIN